MRPTAIGLSAAVLSAALVAPAMTAATAAPAVSGARPAMSAPAHDAFLVPRHRSDWDALETRTMHAEPKLHPDGVVVHHTESTNHYTRAQVPDIIRGIQQFHVQERGWDDIGYQLLVDRFGRVWEGRDGGFTRPVDGAHVEGLNSHFLGVAYIGDTSTAPVTEAAVDAIVEVSGWAAARYHFSPRGEVRVDGVDYPAVGGHRRYNETECPGRSLALRLPEIRWRATARAADWRREGPPYTYAR